MIERRYAYSLVWRNGEKRSRFQLALAGIRRFRTGLRRRDGWIGRASLNYFLPGSNGQEPSSNVRTKQLKGARRARILALRLFRGRARCLIRLPDLPGMLWLSSGGEISFLWIAVGCEFVRKPDLLYGFFSSKYSIRAFSIGRSCSALGIGLADDGFRD